MVWRDWWRLCRGGNTSVGFAAVLITTYASLGLDADVDFLGVILVGLGVSLFMSGGNVLNDLIDLDSDVVNHPDRPLVTGVLTTSSAQVAVRLLFLFSFLVTLIGLQLNIFCQHLSSVN